jgi:hypothetical protein
MRGVGIVRGYFAPGDSLAHFSPIGHEGKSRLESQGADCQDVLPLDIRAEKLALYQSEMQAFTQFLKQIYFRRKTEQASERMCRGELSVSGSS